jgi:2'-5' RNA ligase
VSGLKNPNSKYFIALVPSGEALAALEAIKQEIFETHHLKGALRSPAHITLHRPFEWPDAKEEKLISTLRRFEFGKELIVPVRDFGWFEPRVLFADVVKTQELTDLHTRLSRYCQRELKLLNEINDKRGFHPHITLAFRDLKKPQFYELQEQYRTRKLHLDLHLKGIALLKMHERWQVCGEF